jgi:hypothetical protein
MEYQQWLRNVWGLKSRPSLAMSGHVWSQHSKSEPQCSEQIADLPRYKWTPRERHFLSFIINFIFSKFRVQDIAFMCTSLISAAALPPSMPWVATTPSPGWRSQAWSMAAPITRQVPDASCGQLRIGRQWWRWNQSSSGDALSRRRYKIF